MWKDEEEYVISQIPVLVTSINLSLYARDLLLLLLTANGVSPGGSGTTIRQQTKYKLTTIRQHTMLAYEESLSFLLSFIHA
jgi:hypothetical protein